MCNADTRAASDALCPGKPMDHNRDMWEVEEQFISQEIECFRSGVLPCTDHAKQRMVQRRVTYKDLRTLLLHGKIHEGYAAEQYPRGPEPYKNRHAVRTMSLTLDGITLTAAIALAYTPQRVEFSVITVYWA